MRSYVGGFLIAAAVVGLYLLTDGFGLGTPYFSLKKAGAPWREPVLSTEPSPEPARPRNGGAQPPPAPDSLPARNGAPPDGDLAALVADQLGQLTPGRILYDPPDRMRVGDERRIHVRIGKDLSEDLARGLPADIRPRVELIRVGTFMAVEMKGEAFAITALSSREQIVASDGFTEWLFDVQARRAGRQVLTLLATVRIKLPGQPDEQRHLPALERAIEIDVNPVWTVTAFFEEHWQWFLGGLATMLAAVLGYLLKRWWERNDPKPS